MENETLKLEIENLKSLLESKNAENNRLESENTFLKQKSETLAHLSDKDQRTINKLNKLLSRSNQENFDLKNLIPLSKVIEDFHEVETDTIGLIQNKHKSLDTKDLQSIVYENKEVQTVYFDQIESSNNNQYVFDFLKINDSMENLTHITLTKGEQENKIEKESKKENTSKGFRFMEDYVSKNKETGKIFNEMALKNACDNFKLEINNFFSLLEAYLKDHKETDLIKIEQVFIKLKDGYIEDLLKNVKLRDIQKMKEISELKINFFESKLELEESNHVYQESKMQFQKLKSKFEQFFHSLIKIQLNEEDSLSNLNITNSQNNIYESAKSANNLNPYSLENSPKTQKMLKGRKSLVLPDLKRKTELTKIPKIKLISSSSTTDENKKNYASFNNSHNNSPSINELDFVNENEINVFPQSTNETETFINLFSRDKMSRKPSELSEISEIADFLKTTDDKELIINKKIEKNKDKKFNQFDENVLNLINDVNACLPHKKIFANIQSPNSDKCAAFLLRIEASTIQASKNVSLSTVLKAISQIQTEIVKNYHAEKKKGTTMNPLIYILFESLFKKYNKSREETETKLIKIIQGCLNYLYLPRVKMFAKLLNIIPEKKIIYDGDDLLFYCNLLSQLDDNPMIHLSGLTLALSPQDKVYIGLNKAIEFINKFCINSTNFGHISKVKGENYANDIKNNKVDDPMVFRRFAVDVDFVISRIFDLQEEIYNDYRQAFKIVDLNNDETIDYQEFYILMKQLEKSHINEKEISELFQNEYDFLDNEKNERFMSFKKFANLCLKKNLCSMIRQETFIRKCLDDIKTFDQLKEIFEIKKNLIKLKLIKTNNFDRCHRKLFKYIEEGILRKKNNEKEKNLIFLRYRLLDEEAHEFIINLETDSCLPKEFNWIQIIKEN